MWRKGDVSAGHPDGADNANSHTGENSAHAHCHLLRQILIGIGHKDGQVVLTCGDRPKWDFLLTDPPPHTCHCMDSAPTPPTHGAEHPRVHKEQENG